MSIQTNTPKTLSLAAILSLGMLAGHGAVQAEEPGIAGRKVGETIFATIDTNGRGWIHAGDLEQFRALVFVGMDADDNQAVNFNEFSSWDPGFAYVAEQMGRSDAYLTASKIVFSFWDRNGNDALTESEMRFAMTSDFRRADVDDDSLLTQEEFLQGFPIMVAMRAALRPDP